jgi:hypothetical protein
MRGTHLIPDLVTSMHQDGFAYVPNFLPVEWVDSVLHTLASGGHVRFNQNTPLGVFDHQQYYDTFALAKSRSVFDFMTSEFVGKMCELYLRDYILKCHRYYETYGDHVMGWHTDSKNQTSGVLANHPGLVFIVYLTDVEYGEFQLVKGSHRADSGIPFQEHYSPEWIDANCRDRVVSLKGKRGSLVIQETRAIHRAKPMRDDGITPNAVRKSLFFQIDTYPNNTEHMYLNPKWLDLTSMHQHKLFRYGRHDIAVEPAHPRSSLNTWDGQRFPALA